MKVQISPFCMNWFVFLYFVILFAERLQSIIRSCLDKDIRLLENGFHTYVNLVTILSLTAFMGILLIGNKYFLKALFTRDAVIHEQINYLMLSITVGVILIGGMVHTEYTIAPVQFISYGMLIVALIMKTASVGSGGSDRPLLWLSLAYLIAFSMAIPVVYHSDIPNAGLFHAVEAIVAILLVAAFTYFTYLVFAGKAGNLFLIVPLVITVIGDAAILAMRWKEKVNGFVLIFLVISSILWVIGKIVSAVQK